MRPIPKTLREEMGADPFYSRCCLSGVGDLEEKVDWHHNLIYASKQVQRKFAILPVSRDLHNNANRKNIKEFLDWVMVNRALDSELEEFSKVVDWKRIKRQLNEKYGVWTEGMYPLKGSV